MNEEITCALCQRPILPQDRQSLHHLIPKLRGGKGGPTVLLHQMCHNEIHATLSEAELARIYNTPTALREHPHLAKFCKWLKTKPPGFDARSRASLRKRNKRG